MTKRKHEDDGDVVDKIDMRLARNRAHAILGGLSSVTHVEITPAEFWDVFSAPGSSRDYAIEFVNKSERVLAALEAEYARRCQQQEPV